MAVGSVLSCQEGCPSRVPFSVDVPKRRLDLHVLRDALATPHSQSGGALAAAQRGLGELCHLLTPSHTPRPNRLSTLSTEAGERSRTPSWQGCTGGTRGTAQSPATSQCPGDGSGTQPRRPGTDPDPEHEKPSLGEKNGIYRRVVQICQAQTEGQAGSRAGAGAHLGRAVPLARPHFPSHRKANRHFFPPLLFFGVTKPKATVKLKDQVCGASSGSQSLASKAAHHPVSPCPGITVSWHRGALSPPADAVPCKMANSSDGSPMRRELGLQGRRKGQKSRQGCPRMAMSPWDTAVR